MHNMNIRKLLSNGGRISASLLCILLQSSVIAQETNSHVSGIVRSLENNVLQNATVIVVHEPTKNTYSTRTNEAGYFYFFNIKPGGPYTITISHIGYEPVFKTDMFLSYSAPNFYSYLQGAEFSEFILKKKKDILNEVVVKATKLPELEVGIETNITSDKLLSLPSISRNLQDYVRIVPYASVNGDGGISLAGQNNKYNAFFIDGANTNDLLGLAPSGINGGQASSPPISVEAIEQIKLSIAPYDVQYSNFTGGSMNAITRSGDNTFKSSSWYFFRNEKLAGKSPEPIEVSGSPGVFKRQRLSAFTSQNGGAWISGPLSKNKLFYFLLCEKQKEYLPQPYNFADYKGNSSQQVLTAFGDTLRTRYGYEAGSFLETNNGLDATRINAKVDWNASVKNKLLLSYRYNHAERTTAQSANTGTFVRFENNMYKLIAETHTASLEWKAFFNPKVNNRLLATYTNHVDDRNLIGKPFPQIQITDGSATVVAGSNGSAQINLFKGADLTLLDVFKVIMNKQVISAGGDFNFSKLNDVALVSYFGNYQFNSFNSFFSNGYPIRLIRAVSLVDQPKDDNTNAGSNYNTRRISFFVADDIQVNTRFKITSGLRLDGNVLPHSFATDTFFDKVARPEIEKYYNLEDAKPGQLMNTHWQLSPRVGIDYKVPNKKLSLHAGAGLFTGHIINVWSSEFYNVNVFNMSVTSPQLYNIRFNPDPYSQPTPQSLGINAVSGRGDISIVSKKFKYPVVFKTSVGLDKKLFNGWTFTAEFLFTKNVHEHSYTNVNLLPPTKQSTPPDQRNIFSLNAAAERIAIIGFNPYNNIILLTNYQGKKGYSYGFTGGINKNLRETFFISAAYAYSHSVTLFEPNYSANTSLLQWLSMKTVNGKNFAIPGTSDFDLKHRILVDLTQTFSNPRNKFSTLVSIFYNGQSGAPFSYVYDGSILNDGRPGTNSDLIYVPSGSDLQQMVFLPLRVGNIIYSAEVQKQSLNEFIERDKYLSKHRGMFAQKNGARLPFTHLVDVRLQQNFTITAKKRSVRLSIIYDVFNFTNMLNKKWGRTYLLSDGMYPLITFAGFVPATLTPQYQFRTVNGTPWTLQNSTFPGSSARWISQLGLKINFE